MSKPDTPQKDTYLGTEGAALATTALSAFRAIDAPGRRSIRIFAMPGNQLVMAAVGGIIVGIPMAFFITLLPIWDYVDDFALIRNLNSYIAPGIDGIREATLPEFPLKRVLIASTSIVELLFLGNFLALFSRKTRRHALLVWACYDRTKLLQYFVLSALIFGGLWYLFFIDWELLRFITTMRIGRRGNGLVAYAAMLMPLVAVVFGHLTTIVCLGAWRTASRQLRRFRESSWA
jgi:hypothetical protein